MALEFNGVSTRVKSARGVREVAAEFDVVDQLDRTGSLVDFQIAEFTSSAASRDLLVARSIER